MCQPPRYERCRSFRPRELYILLGVVFRPDSGRAAVVGNICEVVQNGHNLVEVPVDMCIGIQCNSQAMRIGVHVTTGPHAYPPGVVLKSV